MANKMNLYSCIFILFIISLFMQFIDLATSLDICIVKDSIVSSIGGGLCLLVGISRDDTVDDVDYMVNKVLGLRVFEDDNGKMWAKNVKDSNFEILSVSQFTLYGTTTKGTKPDFHLAMKSDLSCSLYNEFLSRLRQNYDSAKVQDGQFGAHMSVSIVNDGPVTLILESKAKSVVAQ